MTKYKKFKTILFVIGATAIICILYIGLIYNLSSTRDRSAFPLDTLKYVTTISEFTTKLSPLPNAGYGQEILSIPPNTKLKIIEGKDIKAGMTKVYWFKVEYQSKIGWISSYSTKEGEKANLDPRRGK